MGPAPYATASHLSLHTFLPGSALRHAVNTGHAMLHRRPMSTLAQHFVDEGLSVDVLLLHVSEPDEHGNMSLGVTVDYMPDILSANPLVIAQINPNMPFTLGDTTVRKDQIDFAYQVDSTPIEMKASRSDAIDEAVARNVLRLLRDEATLQYGIGTIPDTIISRLSGLRDIGLQSGFITEAALAMMNEGVISNRRKLIDNGSSIATAAGGSFEFYRRLHRNNEIRFRSTRHTHDSQMLGGMENFFAINSALQVDLNGSVNAETAGTRIVSAPGGFPDFAEAGTKSTGGASIVALRSTSRGGNESTIVRKLPDQAPITVIADHVTFIVTEFGIAEIAGTDAPMRAKAIASVAHPDHRADLMSQ
ncbi:MAG: hypothetical protein OXR62_11805 [Ahrensia sp.]|nr:hypothetical protein [Ahrensia sp.]